MATVGLTHVGTHRERAARPVVVAPWEVDRVDRRTVCVVIYEIWEQISTAGEDNGGEERGTAVFARGETPATPQFHERSNAGLCPSCSLSACSISKLQTHVLFELGFNAKLCPSEGFQVSHTCSNLRGVSSRLGLNCFNDSFDRVATIEHVVYQQQLVLCVDGFDDMRQPKYSHFLVLRVLPDPAI